MFPLNWSLNVSMTFFKFAAESLSLTPPLPFSSLALAICVSALCSGKLTSRSLRVATEPAVRSERKLGRAKRDCGAKKARTRIEGTMLVS